MKFHEDDRRRLYEYSQGFFKSAKAIIMKQTTQIGNHRHDNKEEQFFLLQGRFLELQIGKDIKYDTKAPYFFIVPKGVYHSFTIEKDSILLTVATEPYDEKDELK